MTCKQFYPFKVRIISKQNHHVRCCCEGILWLDLTGILFISQRWANCTNVLGAFYSPLASLWVLTCHFLDASFNYHNSVNVSCEPHREKKSLFKWWWDLFSLPQLLLLWCKRHHVLTVGRFGLITSWVWLLSKDIKMATQGQNRPPCSET